MANAVKWSALGTYTALILGADVAPTLKNLANNGQKLGTEVDNSTDRNQYGEFELMCRGAAAFTAGTSVELYLIQAVGGTAYADGDDSIAPPLTALVGVFPLRAVTTQQRIAMSHILLPPTKFKPLVINKGGQAFTNTDAENLLYFRSYNDEIQ